MRDEELTTPHNQNRFVHEVFKVSKSKPCKLDELVVIYHLFKEIDILCFIIIFVSLNLYPEIREKISSGSGFSEPVVYVQDIVFVVIVQA